MIRDEFEAGAWGGPENNGGGAGGVSVTDAPVRVHDPGPGRSAIERNDVDAGELVDLARGKRMATSVACHECPDRFEGPTAWPDYARHVRQAHPQTIPSPRQRRPDEPAAIEKPAAIAGGEEAPAMAKIEIICPVPNCTREARHRGWHNNQRVKGDGGGPAMQRDPNPPPGTNPTPGMVVTTKVGTATLTSVPAAAELMERAVAAARALDRFGWHLEGCPAYDAATGDGPASEVDDPATSCACGFRGALKEATAS